MRTLLFDDLRNQGFEFYTLEEERHFPNDDEIVEDMVRLNCNILLYNGSMARYWLFTNLDAVYEYFIAGGKVGFDNAGQKVK